VFVVTTTVALEVTLKCTPEKLLLFAVFQLLKAAIKQLISAGVNWLEFMLTLIEWPCAKALVVGLRFGLTQF
jgi:hypothetical protein